jgi:hypothetical protein
LVDVVSLAIVNASEREKMKPANQEKRRAHDEIPINISKSTYVLIAKKLFFYVIPRTKVPIDRRAKGTGGVLTESASFSIWAASTEFLDIFLTRPFPAILKTETPKESDQTYRINHVKVSLGDILAKPW